MEISVADQITVMTLNIINVMPSDFRTYRCVAKNALGEKYEKIRLVGKNVC